MRDGVVFKVSFGVPVTVTALVNVTWTWIVAPAAYAPFAFEAVTFVTAGAVESNTNVRVVVDVLPAPSVAWAVIVYVWPSVSCPTSVEVEYVQAAVVPPVAL